MVDLSYLRNCVDAHQAAGAIVANGYVPFDEEEVLSKYRAGIPTKRAVCFDLCGAANYLVAERVWEGDETAVPAFLQNISHNSYRSSGKVLWVLSKHLQNRK